MTGAFEITGVYARKTTAFGAGPAVEVEIRLAGGAAGRAVAAIAAPFAAVVPPAAGLTDRGGRADEMVKYINTVIGGALKSGDAYYMEALESRLKSTIAAGRLLPIQERVLSAVAQAASRARTAQLRAGALAGWNLAVPEGNTK